MPDPLPSPPADLSAQGLPIFELPSSSNVYRIHTATKHFLHFGKNAKYRFDDPLKRYGVLYVSLTPEGAFIETLGPISRFRTIDNEELVKRSITEIQLNRAVKLLDLRSGVVQLGLDERISVGDDYEVCRSWSRAGFEHPAQIDGIYYRARHFRELWSVALFGRSESALDLKKSRTESLGSAKSELRRRIIRFFGLRIIL